MGPISLLEDHREPLERLCRQYAVRRLRLFGSALTDRWDPLRSDIDFLAEFGPPEGMDAFERYMGFVLALRELLGHEVEVVDWHAAKNPFFRRSAERLTVELYAA
ncbi:MAG: nucleotidyltransferase domain-containing protein [Fimbriimonadaceae bacterium]|nr:nucleotidyltransferase domain-containing protein [Fimbriimonadaceae bacterium]